MRQTTPKIVLPLEDLDSHVIHGSLGSVKSTLQLASQSVQSFCRAHTVIKRQTDHATQSVAIGRLYVILRYGPKTATVNNHHSTTDTKVNSFTQQVHK